MLTENVQEVSMEEGLLKGEMFPHCFKDYPHSFYSSFCVNPARIPGCGTDILAKAYAVSIMQILILKIRHNVDMLQETTQGFFVSFLTCKTCLLVYFISASGL